MRKAEAVFAVILIAGAAFAKPQFLTADCIAPGCTIVLKQRAMFIEDASTCEWEYIPGVSRGGHTLIRGRESRFTVVRIEERDGEETVLASGEVLFKGFKEGVRTFRFAKIYLQNVRAISIEK